MASAYSTGRASLEAQVDTLCRRLKQLVNKYLQAICRNEGLAVTGVKTALQSRIIDYAQRCARNGDADAIQRLSYGVSNNGATPPRSTPAYNISSSPPDGLGYNMSNGYGVGAHSSPLRPHHSALHRPKYKRSPFYDVLESVTKELEIPKLEGHRQQLPLTMSLSQTQVDRIKMDPSLRIYLFCCSDATTGAHSGVDVAFPHQLEIKVNGEEVKANYKGLKNKPGTTRPADITSFCRTKLASYANQISVMFALTTRRYMMQAWLVKKRSVTELTEKIRQGRFISKQRVLNEMIAKANDPDLEATSTTLSLKDPISTLRLKYPCRSTTCNHNQCFDALMFLELQEQAPTWTCPVCNKVVTFDGLAIDEYVQEILQSTARSTEQVTVEPNGVWKVTSQSTSDSRTSAQDEDDEDSDDLVELYDYHGYNVKTETPVTPFSFNNTPPLPDPVAAARNNGNSGGGAGSKRRSDVIDLTLSDDDEPPPKRPAFSSTTSMSNIHHPMRNGYSMTPSASSNTMMPNHIDPFRLNGTSSNHGPSSGFALPQPSRAPLPPTDYYHGSSSGYGR